MIAARQKAMTKDAETSEQLRFIWENGIIYLSSQMRQEFLNGIKALPQKEQKELWKELKKIGIIKE